MNVVIAPGTERGQFDVLVDGTRVASRSRHVLVRTLGIGWPSTQDVIAAVRRRLRSES